jgi:16S rRNA processing protein RimM
MVVVGSVAGVFGVHGWIRVFSHTTPREHILDYSPWYLEDREGWEELRLVAGQRQGKGLLAHLEGCADRDQAMALMGRRIAVRRDQLPPLEPEQFYWADLEGLRVVTQAGLTLGQVDHLSATGANDVLVVRGERERLVPFVWGEVVKDVDLEQGLIRVDWDPDF